MNYKVWHFAEKLVFTKTVKESIATQLEHPLFLPEAVDFGVGHQADALETRVVYTHTPFVQFQRIDVIPMTARSVVVTILSFRNQFRMHAIVM